MRRLARSLVSLRFHWVDYLTAFAFGVTSSLPGNVLLNLLCVVVASIVVTTLLRLIAQDN